MTSEPDHIPRPYRQPEHGPPQKPGSGPVPIPGGLATPEFSSLLPNTVLRQVDVGTEGHNATGDQVVGTIGGRSEQPKAEPESDGPEYLWSCMEGHTFGSAAGLASHSGKSSHLEGDHRPLGMVDSTTGQVVWRWTTAKQAYGLYQRLKAGQTIEQALSVFVMPTDGVHSRLIPGETTTTKTTATTRSPVGKSNTVASDAGTAQADEHKLGGSFKPVVWWLDPRLGTYYEWVKDGLAAQGFEYTDTFPQFLFHACVGFLIEHGSELGIGGRFISETEAES